MNEKDTTEDNYKDDTVSKEQELASLTGAESYLVGLCPHYWAHVPLFIADVHRLKSVNGIDCLKLSSSSENQPKYIPVSKCLLTGIIVAVHPKLNNSTLYLLDDGTGLMDCLEWAKEEEYQVPMSLLAPPFASINQPQRRHRVGDLVQIWGKIRMVRMDADGSHAVREIHVVRMQCAAANPPPTQNNRSPKDYDDSWQVETQHIQKVCDWHDQYNPQPQPSSPETKNDPEISVDVPRNSVDVLRLLGPTLTKQIMERLEWPSAKEDSAIACRVFGPSCRCIIPDNMKEEFLYCWCQATKEPRDSEFKFREALLCHLLRRQEEDTENQEQPLCFAYQSILDDEKLIKLANHLVGNTSSSNIASTNTCQSLVQKTVAALRQDGVLFLLNRDSDEYLLITRSRVLEPMICNKEQMQDTKSSKPRKNPLWQFIPKARINYIQSSWRKQKDDM